MRIIQGEARGRRLLSPAGKATRPPLDRIRESVFSLLAGGFEGRRVLDLFAGMGSLGLEAVSRGARSAVFVEKSPAALAALGKNIANLGFGPRCEVFRGDALHVPRLAESAPFSLVFLDPPFTMFPTGGEGEDAGAVLKRVKELLRGSALLPDGVVVLRLPSKFPWASDLSPRVRKVYGESAVLLFTREDAGPPSGPGTPPG